jgi:alkylation response protein AidB-like acyl-CoA dehydrogenase
VDFRFTESDLAWREEVRGFFREALPDDYLADLLRRREDHSPELWMKLAGKNWLGLAWPKEFGGLEKNPWEQMIFEEESVLAGTPRSTLAMLSNTVGQLAGMIMEHGTPEQQDEWLPAIARGDLTNAEGLTEPNAGSDLTGLETHAARDGDDWIINGSKIFNTSHLTTHMLALIRTDQNAPRHRGLSFFLIDLKSPGISITSMETMARWRRDSIYFEDVRVPAKALIGDLNRGWYQFASPRSIVMIWIRTLSDARLAYDAVLDYAKRQKRDGVPLASVPWVRQRLSELAVEMQAAELFNRSVIWRAAQGQSVAHLSAMAKVTCSELQEKVLTTGMDILGVEGGLESWMAEDENVPLRGRLPFFYRDVRVWSIAGGANEIKRNIVAQRGLGLPRD